MAALEILGGRTDRDSRSRIYPGAEMRLGEVRENEAIGGDLNKHLGESTNQDSERLISFGTMNENGVIWGMTKLEIKTQECQINPEV